MFPKKLQQKLNERIDNKLLRQLGTLNSMIDFSSNDYLGLSKSDSIFKQAHQYLLDYKVLKNGAAGSRLLCGNHELYPIFENKLCKFHNSDAALVFNSGYDANLGFFSTVPQRNDIVFYDELSHASIRDGIKLGNAKPFKFKHNDLEHLEEMLYRLKQNKAKSNATHFETYVVTEAVFSMDGDSPDLVELANLCEAYNVHLVIDEAHSLGIYGNNGEGLTQELNIEHKVFARIITFGKAIGCHGAAVLGSEKLKSFLINFSRSFIYTTGLPPHTLATLIVSYNSLKNRVLQEQLRCNITFFKKELQSLQLKANFIESNSAIQCCIIKGNNNVKGLSNQLQTHNFNVKAILSPTVTEGQERLRFCLHTFNTENEITSVLKTLKHYLSNNERYIQNNSGVSILS